MLLLEAGLLAPERLAVVVAVVWEERDATAPPAAFPELPQTWPTRYEQLAAENGIEPRSFPAALDRAVALWRAMFASG